MECPGGKINMAAVSAKRSIKHEDAKKITIVKEVWCPVLICDFMHSFLFAFNDQFDKLYQTLETVFHQVSKHLEVG